MDEAQAAEAGGAGARAPDVGQLDLLRVPDDDPLDLAPPVEQHAELAAGLPGKLGQMARKLDRAQLALLHAAAVGGKEPLRLARLQAGCVAEKLVSRTCSGAPAADPGL